ncbi:Fic family protein [Leucobacter albus]|uniref:Fic family protein n=1 Tax=Leucobacter albus TaxID=272210 RepID=A0ABW3TK51_9MICO
MRTDTQDTTGGAYPPVAVPALEYETLSWIPRAPERYSRAETARQTGAYRAAVPPSIANRRFDFSAPIAADMEDAARALTEFDHYSRLRLGAQSPALGPMSAVLLRTESASSSQIEHLTTSAKQLALAEIAESDKHNARLVVGNVRAMEAALRLADSLDTESILSMHRELLSRDALLSAHAGRLREEAVWIGGDNAGPIGAEFVAPHHSHLPASLDDLVTFIRRTDLPALAQVAIAHAQFETLHPFVDGNGRTGRALSHAMLRSLGLATHATVPLSAGLLVDTSSYFAALTNYRAGDAGPIMRRFADAARFAAATGRDLLDALALELERSRELLAGVRKQSAAWKVLPQLVGQPVVNLRYLRDTLNLQEMTALRALNTLAEREVLTERSGRARNRVWEHRGFLGALDSYGSVIRRASR